MAKREIKVARLSPRAREAHEEYLARLEVARFIAVVAIEATDRALARGDQPAAIRRRLDDRFAGTTETVGFLKGVVELHLRERGFTDGQTVAIVD